MQLKTSRHDALFDFLQISYKTKYSTGLVIQGCHLYNLCSHEKHC